MGWIVRNGICYREFNDTMTADDAVSFCEQNNAYLAEIPNIYVDNIITEIVGENGDNCWTGLRTDDTSYYWRIGEFPLGNDTALNDNINECGAIHGDLGNRWHIHNCGNLRNVVCMIGKQFLRIHITHK